MCADETKKKAVIRSNKPSDGSGMPARRARAIMVQGTMSNAGKSLLVAGLCLGAFALVLLAAMPTYPVLLVSAELDEESLVHYLSFLTTPAPRTLFRGVGKLPAGPMLVCGRGGGSSASAASPDSA